jgi:hypothetical protein
VVEFVLTVLDNRERRRRHRTRRAHDKALAIWRHIELKVPGGAILRGVPAAVVSGSVLPGMGGIYQISVQVPASSMSCREPSPLRLHWVTVGK